MATVRHAVGLFRIVVGWLLLLRLAAGLTAQAAFDLTPPVLECPAGVEAQAPSVDGSVVVNFEVTVTDDTDPEPVVVSLPASGSLFPVGTTVVRTTATDGDGNQSFCEFVVTVTAPVDSTPPVLHVPAGLVAVASPSNCLAVVEFSVTAEDDRDPAPQISVDVPSGSEFPLGTTVVHCQATDADGNIATAEFTVRVDLPPPLVIECPADVRVAKEADIPGAVVNFPDPVLTDPCRGVSYEYEPASGSVFPVGETVVTRLGRLSGGTQVVCQFKVVVVDDDNIVWPRARELSLNDNVGILEGGTNQALLNFDESRWYKFRVQPGSRVVVTLTDLPANYDLVLFKDIAKAYQQLTSPADLPRLDAEFADDAFSPAQFSPAQFSPAQFSPAAFSPAAFSPAQFSPAQFSPAQFSPAQFSPAQFSPDAYSPAQFSPAQFSPAQFSPAQFSPAQFSPAQFSPAQFSEAAYASAQTRSVIAVSAFDGLAGEGLIANTWEADSDFYLRVRGRQGAFDPAHSFRVEVFLYPGICQGLLPTPVNDQGDPLPPSTFAAPATGARTLILVDFDRLTGAGPSADRTALQAKLAELAARPEVRGEVLDVGADGWVRFFNAQADANPQCPYAKNLLAEAIRAIINRSYAGNALEYLVVVGGDAVVPFFRHPDEALLGPEQDFVPPVLEFSPSQAALRQNFFLSQDRYGARIEIARKNTRLPLMNLAVGRLVETPDEIIGMVDAYLDTGAGILPPPQSLLVTGYDFLEDAARAVADELQAGTGLTPDTLISPSTLSPKDPRAWKADDLRPLLLGTRHDVLFLAGHFHAAGLLAADYTSRFYASELLTNSVDLRNALLYSVGCHSGYNIVDADAIPGVTPGPDWSQVCARKQMTLVAGTGYQYGDTDFVEYSERLYLAFTRYLRTGDDPVAIGKALLRAKQEYLSTTADLRGIHEKSVLQATLFGLPMLRANFAGARRPTPTEISAVESTQAYTHQPPADPSPGEVLGLRYADLSLQPNLVRKSQVMNNAERDPNDPNDPATVTCTWFSGDNGLASQPAEPVLPLVLRSVDVPGLALRGVGFRGGRYTDVPDVIALTGAATTELRGVHPEFISEVFYPPKFWRPNYYGGLFDTPAGGTRLVVTPAQVRTLPGQSKGTIRTFEQTDFRLYYSGNTTTYTNDAGGPSSTPALSAPPSIAQVRGWFAEGRLQFRVSVIGNPAAGIQEVWVTYTADEGPWLGQWLSLNLQQDPDDSRVWVGELDPGATPLRSIHFLAQALNGVGLVAFNANQGAFFSPELGENPAPPSRASLLNWVEPPTTAPYGQSLTVRARLTAENAPVSGQPVTFKIGSLEVTTLTDGDGLARARVNALLAPGVQALRASFAGTTELLPSVVETTCTLQPTATTLRLTDANVVVGPDATSTVEAQLTDDSGRPLNEQSVAFVVLGSRGRFVQTAITDFQGLARLGAVNLDPGVYVVLASFGKVVVPPAPFARLGSTNALYGPAEVSGSLAIRIGAPVAADDRVTGRAAEPLQIPISDLLVNDTGSAGGNLTLSAVDAFTWRGTSITRTTDTLTLGRLADQETTDTFNYQVTDDVGSTATAQVTIQILKNGTVTPNFLFLSVVDGALEVHFRGVPGERYRVQFSPSLTPAEWNTIGTVTPDFNGAGGLRLFDVPAHGYIRTVYP